MSTDLSSKDKFEEADEEYSQATTLLEPLVRKDVKSAVSLSLAKIFRKRGDLRIEMGMYHDALKDFKKYRKLVELIGNALELQRSHHSLGRAYFMLGISSKGMKVVEIYQSSKSQDWSTAVIMVLVEKKT